MTILGLALAGCGPSTPRGPAVASPAQVAADAASAAYSVCVDKAVAALDPNADQPAALADRAVKSCAVERATVAARVEAAQVAGGMEASTARMVAERAVRVADSDLRERANAALVTRKLKAS